MTPRTAACQASLSFTISLGLLKLMFFESVMPSTISSSIAFSSFCSQSFQASGSFPVSQLFTLGGQVIGASASASVFPFRVDFLYDWLIWSPCCPRGSHEFSPAPQFDRISSLVLSVLYGPTLWKKHSFGYMDLCWQSDVSLCVCFFYFIFLSKDSCFTEFSCFLSNLNMNQP